MGIDAGRVERHGEGALRGARRVGDVVATRGGGRREVGVDEHRQAQAAAEHVGPGDAHVARQLMLDGHFAFMHQRIHPVRRLAARGLRAARRSERHHHAVSARRRKARCGAPPGGVKIRFGNVSVGHVVGLQLKVCWITPFSTRVA